MDYLSLIGIAVGLSMDAFAVSITNGAITRKIRPGFAIKIAATFGLFQAFMPFVGWCIGKAGEGFISSIDHWIALVLLLYLGGKMVWESRKKSEEESPLQDTIPWKTLLMSGIATSIDALATGVILPSAVGAGNLWLMLLSVAIIGTVNFIFCFPGVYIGKRFGDLLSSKAELLGGLVLMAIGIKIFVEHMFFS